MYLNAGNYDFDIKPIVPKDGTRKPGDKCVKQTTGFSNSTYHVYNCAGVDAFQITGDTSNPPSGFVSVCEVIIYATYPLFKSKLQLIFNFCFLVINSIYLVYIK